MDTLQPARTPTNVVFVIYAFAHLSHDSRSHLFAARMARRGMSMLACIKWTAADQGIQGHATDAAQDLGTCSDPRRWKRWWRQRPQHGQ